VTYDGEGDTDKGADAADYVIDLLADGRVAILRLVLLYVTATRTRVVLSPYEIDVWQQTPQSDTGDTPTGDVVPALAVDTGHVHSCQLARVVQVRDDQPVDDAKREQRCQLARNDQVFPESPSWLTRGVAWFPAQCLPATALARMCLHAQPGISAACAVLPCVHPHGRVRGCFCACPPRCLGRAAVARCACAEIVVYPVERAAVHVQVALVPHRSRVSVVCIVAARVICA
jgi:hypothetical protein